MPLGASKGQSSEDSPERDTPHGSVPTPCSRGTDPSSAAPAVIAQSCGHLLCAGPDGPGHILSLVGVNAGIHLADFPSAFLKAGFWGAEQLGFLPQQESRTELSTRTGVTCVLNS